MVAISELANNTNSFTSFIKYSFNIFFKFKLTIKTHTQTFLVRAFLQDAVGNNIRLMEEIISGWWTLFLFRENMTCCSCFKRLGFKIFFHWWAHASIFFKSPLVLFAEVFRSRTIENKEVDLKLGFEDRFSAKSLI